MSANYHFSSILAPVIVRYLAIKQGLGRQYTSEQRIFEKLDIFLSERNIDLTVESFTEWCHTYQHLASGVRRIWMRNVRNLCLYRNRTEPLCFIPDLLQFPKLHQPIQPHIFTEEEIVHLFAAIKNIKSITISPMRQENYRLALVLLYTTGLRRGELVCLTIGDYNPVEHTLLIRESKFHKSRVIPLSDDGWNELESFLKIRQQRHLSIDPHLPLLWNRVSKTGSYTGMAVGHTFRRLFRTCNIRTVTDQTPRLHDFRHCFAVHALLRWYNEGANVQTKLPLLATYMGHVSVVSTQYYLRFIEDIVNSASDRFEERCGMLVMNPGQRGVL